MLPAVAWPGATNYELVPGVAHCAVGRPAEICSAARPCAIAPLAVMITPPRPATVVTLGLDPGWPARRLFGRAGAGRTAEMWRRPGWVTVASPGPGAAPPPGTRRVTWPEPAGAEPGTAAMASEAAVGPAEPGAAHAYTAELTGTSTAGVRGAPAAAPG